MKTFELPKLEATILMQVLTNAPTAQQGYTLGDVRSALKVSAVVEGILSGGGPVELEDADYTWLCQRIDMQKWTGASPLIVNLVEQIKGAQGEAKGPITPALKKAARGR